MNNFANDSLHAARHFQYINSATVTNSILNVLKKEQLFHVKKQQKNTIHNFFQSMNFMHDSGKKRGGNKPNEQKEMIMCDKIFKTDKNK